MENEQFEQEQECRMYDTHGTGCYGDCAELVTIRTQLAEAKADNARLREALEWYGEQARLARLIHGEGDAGRHALSDDGGKRARQALADTPEATQ